MRRVGLFLGLFLLGAAQLRGQAPVPTGLGTTRPRVPIATSRPTPPPQPVPHSAPDTWTPQKPAPPPGPQTGRMVIATSAPRQDTPPALMPPAPAPAPAPIAPAATTPRDQGLASVPGKLVPIPPPPQPAMPAGLAAPDSLAPAVAPIIDDNLPPPGPPQRVMPQPASVVRVVAESPPSPTPVLETPPQPAPPALPPAIQGATQGPLLEKIGPQTHNVGQPFRYTIVIRNPSATPLNQVRVQEALPPGAQCRAVDPQAETQGQRLLWDLGVLEPGTERRLSVEVQPAGEGEFQSTATATFAASEPWRMRVTRPQLTVTKKGPETAQVGDEVAFQITIANSGSGPATNVVIHDRMPPGLQHPEGSDIEAVLGTLAAGESKPITLKTTAVRAGDQVNEVRVTADGGLEASARAVVRVTEPGLQVRKTGPDKACLYHELEHRLEVFNNGQAPATSVRLSDELPEGLEFLLASDGGTYDPKTRSVDWTLGTLPPGQSRTATIRMKARTGGDWVNKAIARADRGLETSASAPVHVEGVPALLLEVVDLDDPLEVGAETDYQIRVINQGTSSVSGIAIRAVLPEQMEFVRAEGPAMHHVQGREVQFEPLPKLSARADAKYKVRIRARVVAKSCKFLTYLTADMLTRPVLEEESTCIYDGQGGPPARGGNTAGQ